MTAASTHVLRAAPQDSPEVFREIEIASDKKLADLAKAIVSAFDFQFDHAFGFYSKLTGPEVKQDASPQQYPEWDDDAEEYDDDEDQPARPH